MTGEPSITINGRPLTESQANTVRVAVESFGVEMKPTDQNRYPLGGDARGIERRLNYLRRVNEIRAMMQETKTK